MKLSVFQMIGVVFLCAFALMFLYPLVWVADGAFRPKVDMFNIPPLFLNFNGWPHFDKFTFDNIIRAFIGAHGVNIGLSFLNSTIVTVCGTGLTVLLCSLCAYAFAFIKFPMKNTLFYFILLSFMLPTVTMISPYYKLMISLHLRNNLLGLILPYSISAIGVFLLRQFYIKLPYSLIESAIVDGANHFMIWWKIILPLSTPAIAALSIMCFRYIWNDFLTPLIMLDSNNLFTVPIAVAALKSNTVERVPDIIMATGFIFTAIPVAFFLVFQRYFIEGLSGGIKG